MKSFFNDKAFEMCVWSYEERDRLKSSRIYKAALQMESKYRKSKGISENCNKTVGGCITFAKPESFAELKAKIK